MNLKPDIHIKVRLLANVLSHIHSVATVTTSTSTTYTKSNTQTWSKY